MHYTIVLTDVNTKVINNATANLFVNVVLTKNWDYIKKFDRFYLCTHLLVPTILHEEQKTVDIMIRDHYSVTTIEESSEITVSQSCYIEGTILTTPEVLTDSYIWVYKVTT